jgi:hypothetical protein
VPNRQGNVGALAMKPVDPAQQAFATEALPWFLERMRQKALDRRASFIYQCTGMSIRRVTGMILLCRGSWCSAA